MRVSFGAQFQVVPASEGRARMEAGGGWLPVDRADALGQLWQEKSMRIADLAIGRTITQWPGDDTLEIKGGDVALADGLHPAVLATLPRAGHSRLKGATPGWTNEPCLLQVRNGGQEIVAISGYQLSRLVLSATPKPDAPPIEGIAYGTGKTPRFAALA